jgi:succinate dehydrogenase/fumarate reductase-like Fe-S protein
MYAVQYGNMWMARDTLAGVAAGQGLDACQNCGSCLATCRNNVHIARKIVQLKELARDNATWC